MLFSVHLYIGIYFEKLYLSLPYLLYLLIRYYYFLFRMSLDVPNIEPTFLNVSSSIKTKSIVSNLRLKDSKR